MVEYLVVVVDWVVVRVYVVGICFGIRGGYILIIFPPRTSAISSVEDIVDGSCMHDVVGIGIIQERSHCVGTDLAYCEGVLHVKICGKGTGREFRISNSPD